MINRKKNFFLILFLFTGITVHAQSLQHFMPEIALPAVNGDTIRLSSLKGKVVLIDFWASWCGPCRSSNKRLAKLYPKFRDKGFEILGVSLDEDRNEWKRAIEKDKVSWLQIIDDRGWQARTVYEWRIDALPTSYLINKNGDLIAMDLEGKELEKVLKDILGK
jgi:peroxiredoxin